MPLAHGFSAGNYCNAYETQDLAEAIKLRDFEDKPDAWKRAFIMGFFASYELHEIPSDHREWFDHAYHSDEGQRVLELGYTDRRDDDYGREQSAG